MAEGRDTRPIYNIHLNISGDKTEVLGDKIKSQTNVTAAEIGQMTIQGEPDIAQGEQVDIEADQTRRTHREQTAGANYAPRASSSGSISGLLANDANAFILSGKAEGLMASSKFLEAVPLLEDLVSMEGGHNRLQTQLKMAECYWQLGRETKANRVIEEIKRNIINSSLKPSDVKELAKQYSTASNQIRAIILLQCASKLYARDASPNEAADGIERCVSDGDDIVEAMFKEEGRLRVIASDLVIPAMEDMLENLRGINGADPDKKVVEEARCLDRIGFSYYQLGQHSDSIPFREKGIQIMKSQFGSNASKYKIFGSLLHNMGSANHYLGNYTQAESFYLQSIDANEKAEDWSSEKVKQDQIEQTRNCLKITRNKMKK